MYLAIDLKKEKQLNISNLELHLIGQLVQVLDQLLHGASVHLVSVLDNRRHHLFGQVLRVLEQLGQDSRVQVALLQTLLDLVENQVLHVVRQ